MLEKAGLIIFILLILPPLASENGGGAFDDGVDIGVALGTMFQYVGRQMDASGMEQPIDSSSIMTRVLRGEIEPITSTRVDDPPSTWDLVRTGTYCTIYLAQGETISTSQLDALETVFDTRIYPNATEWFHPVSPPSQVEIRIYDMGDGSGGVGGFFIASPLHRDDLYLDIQDISVIDEILAHEFEHMLHYDLDPNGKSITVRSIDPNDSNVVASTIIDPNEAGRGFYFDSGEDVLHGTTNERFLVSIGYGEQFEPTMNIRIEKGAIEKYYNPA